MADQDIVDVKGAQTATVASSAPLAVQGAPGRTPAAMTGEVIPPKKRRRGLFLPVALLALIGGGGYEGYRWFVEGRFLISTDDAYVKADMSTIAAKVAGYVTAVPVVDNTHVVKGQVLATIARIGTQIGAQNAVIDQAKAQLASARAEALRTATEYDRAQKLMQSSFGTQQRLDQALADRDRAAAAVASAVAAVTAAETNVGVLAAQKTEAAKVRGELDTTLDRAERDLSFTVVRAPFDGVVGHKGVQNGDYVQTGTRLLSLVPLDSVYIEANFKETQVGRLRPGQVVTIKPDAFSRSIEGHVDSVAPASGAEFSMLPPENATGNFTKIVQRIPVRISVPTEVAEEGLLRAGLSVEVEVHTRDEKTPPPSVVSALGLDGLASAIYPHRTQPD